MGPLFTENYNSFFVLHLTIRVILYLISATQDLMSCVIFHNKVPKLKVTHSEIYKSFINGSFSMKTTKKAFSRLPVDSHIRTNNQGACG